MQVYIETVSLISLLQPGRFTGFTLATLRGGPIAALHVFLQVSIKYAVHSVKKPSAIPAQSESTNCEFEVLLSPSQ